MARGEVEVALDHEPERKSNGLKLGQRKAAELGAAEAEIGDAEEDVVLVEFGGEPGRGAHRIEEPDDGLGIGFAFAAALCVTTRLDIGAQPPFKLRGQELHAAALPLTHAESDPAVLPSPRTP